MKKTFNKNQNNNKNSKEEQSFKVEQEMQLLDFLNITITNKSSKKIKSLLTHKMITVNGIPTSKYNYLLKKGQVVAVNKYVPPKTEVNELVITSYSIHYTKLYELS